MSDEPEPDDGKITCWCGATGSVEELFDCSDAEGGCGGGGVIDCECGGDCLCVCHHHGEYECPGCDECESCDEDDYDWSDEA